MSNQEKYVPTLDDKLTFLGLTARQAVSAVQQAYVDSKISLEAYNELFKKTQTVSTLLGALQSELASNPPIAYFQGFVEDMGRDMSQETSQLEAGIAIVTWAREEYSPVSTADDEMAHMRRAGLIGDMRVDLISIEAVNDEIWKARLAMAGGHFDIIVTFSLDHEKHPEVENVEEAEGTSVPPLNDLP